LCPRPLLVPFLHLLQLLLAVVHLPRLVHLVLSLLESTRAPNAPIRAVAERMANLRFVLRTEIGNGLRGVDLIVAPNLCSEHSYKGKAPS
jgi:hypothetical protein